MTSTNGSTLHSASLRRQATTAGGAGSGTAASTLPGRRAFSVLNTRLIVVGKELPNTCASELRLARVGLENVAGYLAEGVAGWIKSGFSSSIFPQITVQEFAELQEQIRPHHRAGRARAGRSGRGERSKFRPHSSGRTGQAHKRTRPGAPSGGALQRRLSQLRRPGLLRRAGFRDIANLTGGFDAWKTAGLPVMVPVSHG